MTNAEHQKRTASTPQNLRLTRTPSAISPQRGPLDTRQLIQRALADPSSLTRAEGAHLQRSIGNRVVAQETTAPSGR